MTRSPLTIAFASHLLRELDDELAEDVDLDVVEMRERAAQELDALLDREHRLLVVRRADDADDDAVEDARRARDHVDVPVRHRVVRAGADRGDHARLEDRDARGAVLAATCAAAAAARARLRASVSTTTTPSAREQGRQIAGELWLDVVEYMP